MKELIKENLEKNMSNERKYIFISYIEGFL